MSDLDYDAHLTEDETDDLRFAVHPRDFETARRTVERILQARLLNVVNVAASERVREAVAKAIHADRCDMGHKEWTGCLDYLGRGCETTAPIAINALLQATFDPPTVLRLLDLAQRAEADRAAVERVRALADAIEAGCRKCPCINAVVGYEGKDGIEPGEYCGPRHREQYARLRTLRAALDPNEDPVSARVHKPPAIPACLQRTPRR